MLQLLRRLRTTRSLLIAAGLLAVAASFGLHPEPAAATASPSASTWSAREALTSRAHECPACLTHRSVSVAPLAAVVLQPESIVAPPAVFVACHPDRPAVQPRQNRPPPVAS